MFENLVEILKNNPRKIIYPEGTDARILESAARLKAGGFLTPSCIGNADEVRAAAAKGGFDIEGLEIIDPENYEGFGEMVEEMVKLRKGKMTADECAAALKKSNYFGTMLVKMGKADALLGGATYSTADTVRPALQAHQDQARCAPGELLLHPGPRGRDDSHGRLRHHHRLPGQRGQGGQRHPHRRRQAGRDRRGVRPHRQGIRHRAQGAFLSYSTKGSGKGPAVDLAREACAKAKEMAPEFDIDGEMQFDAAVSPTVGQLKFPGSKVAGYANTFIFPEIQSGNIGYKIAQRLGGFAAYGPILQGLNAPHQRPLPAAATPRRSTRCPSSPQRWPKN